VWLRRVCPGPIGSAKSQPLRLVGHCAAKGVPSLGRPWRYGHPKQLRL